MSAPRSDLRDHLLIWAASDSAPEVSDPVVYASIAVCSNTERPSWYDDDIEWAENLCVWGAYGWDVQEAAAWLAAVPAAHPDAVSTPYESFASEQPDAVAAWRDAGFSAQESMDWCHALTQNEPPTHACNAWTAEVCRWLTDGGVTSEQVLAGPPRLNDEIGMLARLRENGWSAADAYGTWASDSQDDTPRPGKPHPLYADYEWGLAADLYEGDGLRLVTVNDETGEQAVTSGSLIIESVERLGDGTTAVTVTDRAAGTAQLLGHLGVTAENDPAADIDGYERRVVMLPADGWVLRRR